MFRLALRRVLVVFCIAGVYAGAADPGLRGHITDENDAPVAAARITLRPAAASTAGPWQTQTDPAGAFTLAVPGPGDYLLSVEREGYYELKDHPVRIEGTLDLTLTISSVREVFQSVDVNARPAPVDIAQTTNQERLTGTEVNDILYPNSHSFRNSMKLMPGVVEDAGGGLHFNGSSENQVQYTLNGFNLTDPVSSEFRTILAMEGIRSADYSSGRYSPEFGKGSAGVLAISTDNGTDAFHYTATNFIPGIDTQQGIRLGNWYPRLGISGPIRRGRAWFADTFQSQYNNDLITGLPSGENTRSGWAGSNLLHTQVNLTARNLLFADFLVNVDNEGRIGLGPLDPVSTTLTVHSREYFGSLKDQIYLAGRYLIEFGYAHNEFSNRQTPQGQSLYVISPQGRGGNYFVTSNQSASRDQWLVHGYLPQFHLAGSHQIEAGVDANLLRYDGDFRRTGYRLIGLSGQVLSQTAFTGSGIFHVDDTNFAAWVLDTWRVVQRFQIDLGLRQDWDRLVGGWGWSPRLAFSWAPFHNSWTRVAGGYAVTYDAVPLDPFGRTRDQAAVTTEYDSSGIPTGPPLPTTFTLGPGLKLPRATNASLSVDHQISARLTASAKFLHRRGTDGFAFVNALAPDAPPSLLPLPNGSLPGLYQLASLRRDDYDALQISIRQALSGQYEWMASYTRSRAHSNALLDFNAATPLQVLPGLVPMPWDSPNRILAWSYLPLPWKNWSWATLVDARTGFPFSVREESGVIQGPVNSYRYTFHFDLDLAIERMVTLGGYRFALRGGANNLTNARNSTAVNNVIGSPQYLQFFGDEGRHFVVRIRFFGRAGGK